MNQSEYLEWTKYALAAFPTVHRVLDNSAEARERSKQWLAALGGVKMVHAKAAIDAMLRGDTEPPKFDWAQLPAFVIRWCSDQANADLRIEVDRYYDGPTVRCPHCRDSRSGLVAIWNPAFINECDEALSKCENLFEVNGVYREWRRKSEHNRYCSMAVTCCCDSPSAIRKRAKQRGMVFDPQRNCVEGPVKLLKEFLADSSRYEWNPESY